MILCFEVGCGCFQVRLLLVGLRDRLDGETTVMADAFPSLVSQIAGEVESTLLSSRPATYSPTMPLPIALVGRKAKRARRADPLTKHRVVMQPNETAREICRVSAGSDAVIQSDSTSDKWCKQVVEERVGPL